MIQRLLPEAKWLHDDSLEALQALTVVESPSHEPVACRMALDVAAQVCASWLESPARIVELDSETATACLRWGPAEPRVLLLGHVDTVWPRGTLARLPFAVNGDRITGPGVFDMKAGVVQSLMALRLLSDRSKVGLLLTTDEEIGSHRSRGVIAEAIARAHAVLVFEPSVDGALKTRRKGTSWYRLAFTGRAAHAGLDPERGINALLSAARASLDLVGLAEGETTLTPTLMSAGSTANTVPASAELTLDVRAWTAAEQQRVDHGVRHYSPVQGELEVSGGIDRPALESSMSRNLFEVAQRVADALELAPLRQAAVGGASDGNLTAAAGVATLDGLGAVGDGAHAEHEWASSSAMIERAALAAGIIESLTKEPTA